MTIKDLYKAIFFVSGKTFLERFMYFKLNNFKKIIKVVHKCYRDGISNTVEKNTDIFSLIQMN